MGEGICGVGKGRELASVSLFRLCMLSVHVASKVC